MPNYGMYTVCETLSMSVTFIFKNYLCAISVGKHRRLTEQNYIRPRNILTSRQKVKVKVSVAHSYPTLCDPRTVQPTRLLCPWDSPGKNTGVGCNVFLQGIFLTQGLNLSLLHCRQILSCLSHLGSPKIIKKKKKKKRCLITISPVQSEAM